MMAPDSINLDDALAVAAEAVTMAGEKLLALQNQPLEVLCEQGHDIKLKADQQAEACILDVLKNRLPLPVLTEESGEHGDVSETGWMWVVDPLDGTFNYSRGMPLCCSSVALWANGEPVLGAINDFFSNQLFTGLVGRGAWLNGRAIRASGITEASRAALATGFPHHRDMGDASLQRFIAQTRQFKKIRMLGSAALMSVYTACGWLDVYSEEDIWLWDIAAGAAIARAAGAHVDIRPGQAGRWARIIVCAATKQLADALEEPEI